MHNPQLGNVFVLLLVHHCWNLPLLKEKEGGKFPRICLQERKGNLRNIICMTFLIIFSVAEGGSKKERIFAEDWFKHYPPSVKIR